jgi:quercetin dioxygenase-like cupin family protein
MNVDSRDTSAGGPFTEEAHVAKLATRGYRVTRYVYPPGTYFPLHTHEADKIDVLVSGRFRPSFNDESVTFRARRQPASSKWARPCRRGGRARVGR